MRPVAAVAVSVIALAAGFGGSAVVSGASPTAACSPIGFQNGVAGATIRMKKLDPGGFNATGTGAWDKFFRTAKKLVDDHDAACTSPPPPPPATTPPPPLLNPQTYNRGSAGQDARYCVTRDDGYRYDAGGREIDGRRTGNPVAGLRPADEMNGLEPCDPYLGFPPWPAASYNR